MPNDDARHQRKLETALEIGPTLQAQLDAVPRGDASRFFELLAMEENQQVMGAAFRLRGAATREDAQAALTELFTACDAVEAYKDSVNGAAILYFNGRTQREKEAKQAKAAKQMPPPLIEVRSRIDQILGGSRCGPIPDGAVPVVESRIQQLANQSLRARPDCSIHITKRK